MAFTLDELKAHYAQLPESGGLDSRCEMFVPGGLNDQMALDLACRRGKGVYKLSDHVGPAARARGARRKETGLSRATWSLSLPIPS